MNNMFNRMRNFERRFFRDFEERNYGRVEENKKQEETTSEAKSQ